MCSWTQDQIDAFEERVRQAADRLSEENARRSLVEGGSEHQVLHDPDPGDGQPLVATPRGRGKLVREEADEELLIWIVYGGGGLNVKVPRDLTQP